VLLDQCLGAKNDAMTQLGLYLAGKAVSRRTNCISMEREIKVKKGRKRPDAKYQKNPPQIDHFTRYWVANMK
jgi:hypothetical protein